MTSQRFVQQAFIPQTKVDGLLGCLNLSCSYNHMVHSPKTNADQDTLRGEINAWKYILRMVTVISSSLFLPIVCVAETVA